MAYGRFRGGVGAVSVRGVVETDSESLKKARLFLRLAFER